MLEGGRTGERVRVLAALALSLLLHGPMLAMLLPMGRARFERPIRIEAEVVLLPREEATEPAAQAEPVAQTEPVAQAPPAPAPVARPAPKPVSVPTSRRPPPAAASRSKPVLTSQDGGARSSADEHVVPSSPAPAAADSPTAPAPATPPGPSPAAAPAATADGGAVWEAYGQALAERAARHKRYPPPALQRGWQGEVRIALRFAAAGQLLGVEVLQSSGHALLDEQALAMVRLALAELATPATPPNEPVTLVVPVRFRLVP